MHVNLNQFIKGCNAPGDCGARIVTSGDGEKRPTETSSRGCGIV
jgi:hypothetical protein